FHAGENPGFFSVNRNKRSIALDLRHPEGLAIARHLAAEADVLVENYRPGVLDRLGLGYETLREANPRLVYCSVSGFGRTGPYVNRPAVDPILQAMGGLMSITGEPERPPVLVGSPVADLYAAALSAYGVVVALLARSRTGRGQHLEVTLLNAGLYLLLPREGSHFATGRVPRPSGAASAYYTPYQVFRAADGYIFIAVRTDADWRRFAEAIGADHLRDDPRFATNKDRVTHSAALIAALEPILAGRTTADLWAICDRIDVISGPVQTFDQVFRDPQVVHNEMVATVDHPVAGPMRVLGIPIKLHDTPGQIVSPPPVLGQHTDQILMDLGYSADTITDLRDRGVTKVTRQPKT
ncbi:MAG TPA: CoA transferase, partial [Dehalococcoidia bacterium]|nr:CoA transferase [Dehalococcoidia bacterium]